MDESVYQNSIRTHLQFQTVQCAKKCLSQNHVYIIEIQQLRSKTWSYTNECRHMDDASLLVPKVEITR